MLGSAEIRQFVRGFRIAQAIRALIESGTASHLSSAPCSSETLAAQTNCHAPTLRRLLRALASEGLLIEDEAGDFSIADEDRAALTDPEFASMVLGWWLLPSRYVAFASLGEAVRTGRQPYELAFGHDFHEHL